MMKRMDIEHHRVLLKYCTFDEWNEMGFIINAGEYSYRSKDGTPLFSEEQVSKIESDYEEYKDLFDPDIF